jgi:CubicO group peptidase (beta-lactamase class C family)
VPGFAIAVVDRDGLVFACGFGLRDVERKLPMSVDTLVPIGSATKAFSAALIAQLVEQGKLDWERPVRSWIPGFELADPFASAQANLMDLSTHRVGLPRYDAMWFMDSAIRREDLVVRVRQLPLNQPFRSGFQYNNLMVTLAGHAAERAAGVPWETLVVQQLLQPLGMRRSGVDPQALQRDADHAEGYRQADDAAWQRVPTRLLGGTAPAGAIHASVTEMSAWLQMQLNEGRHGQQQIVKPASLRLLHRPVTVSDDPQGPESVPSGYAPGWFVDAYQGHRRLKHGGNLGGFSGLVTLLPDDGVGIVVLSNMQVSDLPGVATRIAMDHALGLTPRDWSQIFLQRNGGMGHNMSSELPARKEGTQPSHELAAYVGVFSHPAFGKVSISDEGGALVLVSGGLKTTLRHWHYDTFVGAKSLDEIWEDQLLQFELAPDGSVHGLRTALAEGVPDFLFVRESAAATPGASPALAPR